MRRYIIVAVSATLAYCVVDAFAHNRGEPGGSASGPVFSAAIAPAPAGAPQVPSQTSTDAAVPTIGPIVPEHARVAMTEKANPPAEKRAVHPAVTVHAAAVAPRAAARHFAKAERVAPAPVAVTAPAEAAWIPPAPIAQPLPITVAQRSPVVGGCSGGHWSAPDAAGVPVLLCN